MSLTGCLLDRVLAALARLRVPLFFQQLGAAALLTVIAAGVTFAGAHGLRLVAGLDPNLIVVGGIVMLVAGMVIVGAVEDAIDQFYITAAARMFDVVMRTAGIVAGIVIALRVAQYLGVPLSISASPAALGPLGAQFTGATLIAACFAVWAYADWLTIFLAAGMGLLGWTGYTLVLHGGAAARPRPVAVQRAAAVGRHFARRWAARRRRGDALPRLWGGPGYRGRGEPRDIRGPGHHGPSGPDPAPSRAIPGKPLID